MDLIQRLLHNRGVAQDELKIINNIHNLLTPELMKGMDSAVARLTVAFEQQQSVVIVGDYDVDGATSTALAIRVLAAMGLNQVNYVIPNRMVHGYGLSVAVVDLAMAFKPELLITVDNGISSHSGVSYAVDNNIDVIITDHHLPSDSLPPATAIINPNQPDCSFPEKGLAGVGVCFYLMIALRRQLRAQNWFANNSIAEPNLIKWLDLVALGTVADLVPLETNNRLLVNMGMKVIRSGKGNCGIRQLFNMAKSAPISQLQISDLSFSIAPRLNAAGRIDDMSMGIDCLICDDESRAQTMAYHLNEINLERRQLQDEAEQQAQSEVANLQLDIQAEQQLCICLYQPHWHQGIVGLVASKIKDMHYRPTIVFAKEDEGSVYLKGSGRSIEGFHIRDALVWIDSLYPDLIERFGGHAMAAGLTIAEQNLEQFILAFEDCTQKTLDRPLLKETLIDDGALSAIELTLENAVTLESFVWGQQFPEPLFINQFNIVEQHLLSNKHLKLNLSIENKFIAAIWFNVPKNVLEDIAEKKLDWIDCCYRLLVNRFRGDERLQLQIIKVNFWN